MSAPMPSNADLIAAIQAQTANQAQWSQAMHGAIIDLAARMDRHHDLPEQTDIAVINANQPLALHRKGRRYLRIYNPNAALTCTLNIPGLPPVTNYSLPTNWSTLNVPDGTTLLGPSGNNNILIQPVDWEPGDEGAASSSSTVTITGSLPAGTNSIGQVTANAGTNLNTSALALETGGNLATIAGIVSSSKAAVKAASGDIADGAITTLGTEADAAWGGSGNGTLIAIQKKIESLLAGTLTVSSSAPINPVPSGATYRDIVSAKSNLSAGLSLAWALAPSGTAYTGPASGKTLYVTQLAFTILSGVASFGTDAIECSIYDSGNSVYYARFYVASNAPVVVSYGNNPLQIAQVALMNLVFKGGGGGNIGSALLCSLSGWEG